MIMIAIVIKITITTTGVINIKKKNVIVNKGWDAQNSMPKVESGCCTND